METNRTTKPGTWLGVAALLLAAGTLAVWIRQIGAVAIPENRVLFIAAFAIAAVLGIAAFIRRTRWFGAVAAVLAVAIGGFYSFTVAISKQELAPNSIRVGETMPQFVALTDQGEQFDSSSLAGQLLLIKFFRAHW